MFILIDHDGNDNVDYKISTITTTIYNKFCEKYFEADYSPN